jgi:hypothetical protein
MCHWSLACCTRNWRGIQRVAQGPAAPGEELADAAIFLPGLAEMTGHDLQAEAEAKPGKNARREYDRLPNGTLVKRGRQMEAELDGGLRR